MAQRSDNREFVEALARGLDIIRSFNEFNPLRTVSDLAAELKLARPTVHRIMLTLEELGYVVQTDNGYYLSAKVIELGFGYIATRGFYGAAKTHMEKLAAQIDQAISLTELVDSDIIYIGRIEVPKVVAYNVALGQRLPAHSTSPGRLLLSGLDDAEIDRRLNMPSLSNVKPMITLSLDQLKTEISKIRAQGWAMTDQTMSLGYRAAAAPVYDATGMMVAAIGIVVHGSEISHENLANSVLPQLVDAASRITDDFVTMSKLPRRRVAPVEAGYVNFAAGATTSA
ncbi:MAG: IclR family transcriptional regulator domain-containing protein [Ilumatobacteraceae bacterium]|jgi:IclR family pca regulon transcriptional regulator